MNRIYQGKVSSVEIKNPDDHVPLSGDWLSNIGNPPQARRHRELFQDAVNSTPRVSPPGGTGMIRCPISRESGLPMR
jgi:hypothetical protein